jgi:sigma-B regulation protein RsbU (phosphoserine phosphatase)
MPASLPHILICTASDAPAEDVEPILANAGLRFSHASLSELNPVNGTPVSVVLVEGANEPESAGRLCERLRKRRGDFIPVLWLAGPGQSRRIGLESGADIVLPRPLETGELLAQIHALLRIKEQHDQLTAKASEADRISKRLQAAYQQLDQELEWAQRIQESFLPQSLPRLSQIEFAARYKPCGRVGGDFYDVFRLDEHHVGFYVADAMGHGVPASLLTVFVKRGVKPKEIADRAYRLVPPSEVLHHLNQDLIAQAVSETPFITMAYVLLDVRDGSLEFARAGHPYPLYVPREGPPTLWQTEGSLLGVFDVHFPVRTYVLQPGDKLLLYTDGMDGAAFEQCPTGISSLLAAAQRHRSLPIGDFVERLAADLFNQTKQTDDLTLLGLQRN